MNPPVGIIQQRFRHRVHLVLVAGTQYPAQFASHFRTAGFLGGQHVNSAGLQIIRQQSDLGGLAGAFAAFKGYETPFAHLTRPRTKDI